MENLKISQLYVGKTDAKDEIVFGSDDDRLLFERTYFIPPHISTDSFLSGEKFYVIGLKGTGKTALLRYLEIQAKRLPNTETRFTLFKSQFSEEERQAASRTDPNLSFSDDAGRTDQLDNDYENLWKWYFHRQVVNIIQESSLEIIEWDRNFEKYVDCVTSVKHPGEASGLMRLFPKFTKGAVEISTHPSLKVEFEWINSNRNSVRFPDLVRQADILFSNLRPKSGTLYIFVDELELKLGSKKQYDRDSRLIRDLIIAVYNLNALSQAKGRWLKIICALRSEVLTAVADLGKEIEKPTFDFGRELSWGEAIPEGHLHLLLQMVCFKIWKTETGVAGPNASSFDSIWGRYFCNGHYALDQQYLLHKTWFRPRDLVMILTLVQSKGNYHLDIVTST